MSAPGSRNLRRVLPEGAITTTPAGYALGVAPGDVDAVGFQLLVDEARHWLREGLADRAVDALAQAMGLGKAHHWSTWPTSRLGSTARVERDTHEQESRIQAVL